MSTLMSVHRAASFYFVAALCVSTDEHCSHLTVTDNVCHFHIMYTSPAYGLSHVGKRVSRAEAWTWRWWQVTWSALT